jgi:hypothetical protein
MEYLVKIWLYIDFPLWNFWTFFLSFNDKYCQEIENWTLQHEFSVFFSWPVDIYMHVVAEVYDLRPFVDRTDFLCTISASTPTGKWNRSQEKYKVWRNSL